MSTAIVSRILAFGAVGGRALSGFGDEFARVMQTFGDDIARNMGSADELTAFIEQNADAIAAQAGTNGDEFLAALRSTAPGMFQQASRLGNGLDGVMQGFLARADNAQDFAGYLRVNEQAIRSQHGDVVYEVLRGSATQIEQRIAGAAAPAAEVVAPAATTASGQSISFLDRLVLRRGQVGMFASASVAGAVVTEFATGGAVSGAAAHGALLVADALQESAPELAAAIRENGLSVLAFGSDLYDTPRDAAVNAGAIVLAENGYHDAAVAVRIANKVSSPTFYIDLLATEPGERPERFVQKVCEESGVDRTQLEAYLRNHPTQRRLIEEQLDISLDQMFPGLAAEAAPVPPSAENPGGARAWAGSLTGQALTNEFNRVVQDNNLNMFSSFSMFFATVLDWVGLESVAEQFRRAVVVDATISQYGDRFGILEAPGAQQAAAPRPVAGGPAPEPAT